MEAQESIDDQPPVDETTATVDQQNMQDDQEEVEPLARRGDVEKCPVCGSHVDAEAYHCQSCRNYFCFHCRARLIPTDVQLQCVNQKCDYYGKLVCDVCDISHEREEEPSVYEEPEDGYWPGMLLLALIAFGVVWYFHSFNVASITALGIFFVAGLLLQWVGVNIFGKHRIVEHQRKTAYHSCIRCGEVVKQTRTTK